MSIVFVSGWAGDREIFADMPDNVEFFLPFLEHGTGDIAKRISKGGNVLIGWSTGANFILSRIGEACSKFDQVILAAPFLKFTKYSDERFLKLMIKKIPKACDEVVEDFMRLCGCELYKTGLNGFKLIEGLEYLRASSVTVSGRYENLNIIHGVKDRVVSVEAGREIAAKLQCKIKEINSGHFIPYSKIISVLK